MRQRRADEVAIEQQLAEIIRRLDAIERCNDDQSALGSFTTLGTWRLPYLAALTW